MNPDRDPPPTLAEIDAYGITHPGTVRSENHDHFFVGSLRRGVITEHTSVETAPEHMPGVERLASLAMVADGVGSTAGGGQAARTAILALVSEISQQFLDAYTSEATDPDVFSRMLQHAALACHESLVEMAEHDPTVKQFATTLTAFLGLWPHGYILQVGDSRCSLYNGGELTQISRDQTMAQDLVDQGALTQTQADRSRWAHVLSSSIGGQQAVPTVKRIVRERGSVVLLCSDGLTKHVSDDQIEARLASMENAKQACEALLQDALDGGGSDNITIIIGRTLREN